jgi:hypothetical protein
MEPVQMVEVAVEYQEATLNLVAVVDLSIIRIMFLILLQIRISSVEVVVEAVDAVVGVVVEAADVAVADVAVAVEVQVINTRAMVRGVIYHPIKDQAGLE